MTATASPSQFDLNSLLSARSGKSLDPTQFSYKLAGEGSVGHYGLDAIVVAEPEVDEARMAFWLPYADGNRRDGVGDLLEVGGIDHSRHVANPISLFDHGKQVVLPIGMVGDPDSGEYKTEVDVINKTARDYVHMYQGKGMKGVERDKEYDHAVFCSQLFDLWVRKFVRGGSIGYQVMKAVQLAPDYENGTPQGLHLIRTKKLESSVVVMPANQSTVHKSMGWDGAREVLCMNGVCGKPLSPYLVKSFSAYAPPAKAQLGWEPRPGNVSGKSHSCKCGGTCGCGTKQAPIIGGPSDEDDYRHPYGKALENGPPIEDLKAADFVHFPEGINGTNCGNCQYQKDGVCQYHGPSRRDGKVIDLRGLKVTPKDCCGEWDAHGVTRPWEGRGEKGIDLGAEMDVHKEEKVPLENIHVKDGVLTAKEDSSIGGPRHYDNELSNTHIPPPPQRQKWTMGKARAKYHAKRLGVKAVCQMCGKPATLEVHDQGDESTGVGHLCRSCGEAAQRQRNTEVYGGARRQRSGTTPGYATQAQSVGGTGERVSTKPHPTGVNPAAPETPHEVSQEAGTQRERRGFRKSADNLRPTLRFDIGGGRPITKEEGPAKTPLKPLPASSAESPKPPHAINPTGRTAQGRPTATVRLHSMKSMPARIRYRAMRTGEKVIAGDLNWLKEEEQEVEHREKGARAKYHRKGLVDQLPDPTGRERESISNGTLANSPGGSEECREDKNTGDHIKAKSQGSFLGMSNGRLDPPGQASTHPYSVRIGPNGLSHDVVEMKSQRVIKSFPTASDACDYANFLNAKAMPEGNRSPKTDRVVANTSGGNAIKDRKRSQVPFVQQQQDSMMKQRMTRNKYRRKGLTDQLPDKTGRERASVENESLANSPMGSEKPTKSLAAKGKSVGLPPNFDEVVQEKGEPYKGPWGVTTEKLATGHERHWASNGIHTQTARGPYKERHEAQTEADRLNAAHAAKKHLTGFEDQTDTEDTVGGTLSARKKGISDDHPQGVGEANKPKRASTGVPKRPHLGPAAAGIEIVNARREAGAQNASDRFPQGRKGLADISAVRAKYRTDRKPVSADKPTRRRLRNSHGGRTLLYIEVPHLKKCGEMAGRLGLKFTHVGFRSGHAKIYLDGDNGLCDAVAQEFGRDIKKPTMVDGGKTKTKSLPNDGFTAEDVEGAEMEAAYDEHERKVNNASPDDGSENLHRQVSQLNKLSKKPEK